MGFLPRRREGQFEEKRGHLSTSFSSPKLTRKNCKDSVPLRLGIFALFAGHGIEEDKLFHEEMRWLLRGACT
jgi:hypothetical protein